MKNIILLSDGTGNAASKVWRTNVWRTFESIDLGQPDQVAFYADGVGTSSFKPLAIIGGMFGHGLRNNVIECYKLILPQLPTRRPNLWIWVQSRRLTARVLRRARCARS
jgi:uncharacterized protein (DUF2235 family)